MHDAVLVRVLQTPADALRNLERALDRQRHLERIDDGAGHVLADNVRLTVVSPTSWMVTMLSWCSAAPLYRT